MSPAVGRREPARRFSYDDDNNNGNNGNHNHNHNHNGNNDNHNRNNDNHDHNHNGNDDNYNYNYNYNDEVCIAIVIQNSVAHNHNAAVYTPGTISSAYGHEAETAGMVKHTMTKTTCPTRS